MAPPLTPSQLEARAVFEQVQAPFDHGVLEQSAPQLPCCLAGKKGTNVVWGLSYEQ